MRIAVIALALIAADPAIADGPERIMFRAGDLTVGSLLENEIARGCSCSFLTPTEEKERGAMVLEWEDGEMASMFVDGRLIRLTVEHDDPGSGKLGGKARMTLSAAGTTVHVKVTTSEVCPPESESCEVTGYSGTVEMKVGKKRGSLKVWGSCGC